MTRWLAVAATLLLLPCRLSVAQGAAVPDARADRIHTEVRQILSSPGFPRAAQGRTPWDRLMQWGGNLLQRFWRWVTSIFSFGASSGVGQVVFWLVLAAMVVVMAWAIAYVVRRYVGRAAPRTPRPQVQVDDLEESGSTDPQDWLDAAHRHAVSGDFRRAYRAVFVAVLLRLDRAGIVKFEPSHTNGEYLRSLRPRPALYDLFRPLANAFDARWYGRAPVTESDYSSSLATYKQADSLASQDHP